MDAIERWPDALQAAIPPRGLLKRVFVVRETDSTQDAARRMSAAAGDVVVAGRQTLGRGRLGRLWADTMNEGLAMTLALATETPERLMLASAVAAALAVESLLPAQVDGERLRVGIKWPNDILVNRRKLAGVLIEQSRSRAYIGVGVNVTQRDWPAELQEIAISLAQCGVPASRLETATVLLRSFCDVLGWPDDELLVAYSARDALRGQPTTFRTGGAIVTGIVREIHPQRGLLVDTDTGAMRLPAQTTSIVKP